MIPLVKESPFVGMGATMYSGSDRYAFTVVAVSPSGKTVWVREDKETRVDGNGMSESQRYLFTPDENAELVQLRLCKDGWRSKRNLFHLGKRRYYRDFSF